MLIIRGESNRVYTTALIFLYTLGAIHWLLFFNFGSITAVSYDWSKEYSYYSVLKQALMSHSVPYYISQQIQGTNRFLAIPEINLFPSVLLLPLCTTGNFILLHTLLMYSLGFVGCLLIKRKYNLSTLPFIFLFLLFNFNGFITSHLSVGHSMWSGYFLLSYYCYYITEIIDKTDDKTVALKLPLILFFILLTGAVHIYIWCLIFLSLIVLFHWKYLKTIFLCISISLILGLSRLAPATLAFRGENKTYKSGFDTVLTFINSLVNIYYNNHSVIVANRAIGWCEFDYYISILGLLFLAVFGIYFPLRNYTAKVNKLFKLLTLPSIIIFLISFGNIFKYITGYLLPLFRNEQQSSRFLIIPLLFLLFISCWQLENMIAGIRNQRAIYILFYLIQFSLAVLLMEHSVLWRVLPLEKYLSSNNIGININIVNVNDRFYKEVIQVSFLISAMALIITSIIIYKMSKMIKKSKRMV